MARSKGTEARFCPKCSFEVEGAWNYCPRCRWELRREFVRFRPGLGFVSLALVLSVILTASGLSLARAVSGRRPLSSEGSALTRVRDEGLRGEIPHIDPSELPDDEGELRKLSKKLTREVASGRSSTKTVIRAIAVLRKLLNTSPDDKEALAALADISVVHGVYAKAILYYKRLIELDPTDVETRLRYANALTLNGDLDKALDGLKALVERHPSNFRAYVFLSIVYAKNGEREKAVEFVRKALGFAHDEKDRKMLSEMLGELEGKQPGALR